MRKSCLDCVRKHIAQAGILSMEVLMGHPEHYWWAIGHLAEAEHEALDWFPQLAVLVRAERLEYMEDIRYTIAVDNLITEADSYVEEENLHLAVAAEPTEEEDAAN